MKRLPLVVERAHRAAGIETGPIDAAERARVIQSSTIFGHYEKAIDRESAYEKLKGRAEEKHAEPASAPQQQPATGGGMLSDVLFGKTGPRGGKQSQGMVEAIAKSAARAIGSELGRQVLRGVLGSILGKRR